MTKAGEVGSQAVYPRASNVLRMPPEGNEEASGSPWTSCRPEKLSMTMPSESRVRKESCFSAVVPRRGWNQWQKCVAPRLTAQSFMTLATSSAKSAGRGSRFTMQLSSRW